MRRRYWLLLVSLLLTAAVVRVATGIRAVRPLAERPDGVPVRFDLTQSAGLFVGVARFASKDITDISYAADDAVDLAYEFSMEPRTALVRPDRVVLAISGAPRKEDSREHLKELRDAGAKVVDPTPQGITAQLRQQAGAAGNGGLLILTFATHGFSIRGIPYVLGSTSKFPDPATSLSTVELFEIASTSGAQRSLILVDACRERVRQDIRGGIPEVLSAAPMIERMSKIDGQAVLYAAAAGKYAFDDDKRKNGVFTASVLEGLEKCCTSKDGSGYVSFGKLSEYVEKDVREWIRKHKDRDIKSATQSWMDGTTKGMLLAMCEPPTPPCTGPRPVRAAFAGNVFDVFDKARAFLWRGDAGERIKRAETVNLDGDCANEVIVETPGRITVFTNGGKSRWSTLAERFLTAELIRAGRNNVVTVSGLRVTILDFAGRTIGQHILPGALHDITTGRETPKHDRRIIAATTDPTLGAQLHAAGPVATVFALNKWGKQLWCGALVPSGISIKGITIDDFDHDGRRDITVTASNGQVIHLDFDGLVLGKTRGPAQFSLIAQKPPASR